MELGLREEFELTQEAIWCSDVSTMVRDERIANLINLRGRGQRISSNERKFNISAKIHLVLSNMTFFWKGPNDYQSFKEISINSSNCIH